MTEPYTAEELVEAIEQLLDFAAVHEEVEGEGLYNANDLPDLARLAATLREYERVVKENAELRERAVALMQGQQSLQEQTVRIRRALGVPAGSEGDTEFYAKSLRADAMRWWAVRDDLAIDRDSTLPDGNPLWRIVGNNYDYYPGPVPATVDEAADALIARAAGEG